jgi:uncharacterized protein YlaI
MLIQCSICKRIRKFGKWIKASEALITDSIPTKYMLCDDCKGVNGGCERLRKLERKCGVVDRFISMLIVCITLVIVVGGLTVLQRWANVSTDRIYNTVPGDSETGTKTKEYSR